MKKIFLFLFFGIQLCAYSQEVHFGPIEKVPVFPGCDSLKLQYQLKKCMNTKIQSLITNNFNQSIADSLKLKTDIIKIQNKIQIDTLGYVSIVKITAPHPNLEKEARRVIQLIPKMLKPATQRLKPVNIYYVIPIYFKIDKENK